MLPQKKKTLFYGCNAGRHTTEMLRVMSAMPTDRFSPRFYVASSTDNRSLLRARMMETSTSAEFMQIYRRRRVGQSFLTSQLTNLITCAHAIWIMIRIRPQVIVCNGPITCIPICMSAFYFKVLGIRRSVIFYVETSARVARVESLFSNWLGDLSNADCG